MQTQLSRSSRSHGPCDNDSLTLKRLIKPCYGSPLRHYGIENAPNKPTVVGLLSAALQNDRGAATIAAGTASLNASKNASKYFGKSIRTHVCMHVRCTCIALN